MDHTDVLVIGAGQAGLSAAHHLTRLGVDHVVLDANPAPGGAWQHRWPSLRLATVNGIFALPGTSFDPSDPQARARDAVPAYFADYERTEDMRVLRPVTVAAVRSLPDGRLTAETDRGTFTARALVNATGTWTKPFRPWYPGLEEYRGRTLHAVDYRGPDEFAGGHVVVVGGGITAVELLTEIAEVAATTWVTRTPPVFSGEFAAEQGREVVAAVDRRVRAGLPPLSVSSQTGLPWTPAVARAAERGVLDRRPMFARLTVDGVAWADGDRLRADAVVWATGWRAALDHLAPLRLRETGGGIRMDGTRVVVDPRVHLVGYGPSASTVGANRAGREAALALRTLVGEQLSA